MYKSYKIIIFRLIQTLSGLGVLYLISTNLNLIEQGYYYALGSIISLIWIFDLGLSQVAVNLLSKNFVGLSWKNNQLLGNKKKFFSTFKSIFNFYFISSFLFILLSPLYFIYLRVDDYYSVKYLFLLTISLSFLVGINFCFLPLLFFLDSAKKISFAYDLRIISNAISFLFFIILFKNDFTIIAIISSQLGILITNIIILVIFRNEIFLIFNYKSQLKNNHKKLLLDSLPAYFSGFAINVISIPVVHNFFGPEISGKYGMSLIVLNLIALISISFYQYNVPTMTRLSKFKFVSKASRKLFYQSILSFIVIYIFSSFVLFFINFYDYFGVSNRFLEADNFLKLILFVFIFNLSLFFNFFTRLSLIDYFKYSYYFFILLIITVFIFIYFRKDYSNFINLILFSSTVLFFNNYIIYQKINTSYAKKFSC
jgi:hypothetical protein